jgi:hypothetical protein
MNRFGAAGVTSLVVLLLLCGCGRSGPVRYRVVGTVKWEDESVPKGDMIFQPVDVRARAEGAKIVDGKFMVYLPPGKMRVKIVASRERPGGVDKAMNSPLLDHYIPAEFNDQSTLERDVQPNDENNFEFDLHPSPPRTRGT